MKGYAKTGAYPLRSAGKESLTAFYTFPAGFIRRDGRNGREEL